MTAGESIPRIKRPAAGRSGNKRAGSSNAPLLTVVACAMGAFLVLKIGHIAFNSDSVPLTVSTASAQENTNDPDKADDGQAEKPADATEPEGKGGAAEGATMDAADKGASKTGAPNANSADARNAANLNATKTEIEVIERLAERRKQLEMRDQEIDLREKLLKATEQKLEKKLSELKQIEARIETAFAKEKKERSDEFKDLVSLYENMKPKRAARIFDELDMDILLSVAQKMNTRKMSAILAQMKAEVAQRLTVELVARVSGGKASGAKQLPSVVERNPS